MLLTPQKMFWIAHVFELKWSQHCSYTGFMAYIVRFVQLYVS